MESIFLCSPFENEPASSVHRQAVALVENDPPEGKIKLFRIEFFIGTQMFTKICTKIEK